MEPGHKSCHKRRCFPKPPPHGEPTSPPQHPPTWPPGLVVDSWHLGNFSSGTWLTFSCFFPCRLFTKSNEASRKNWTQNLQNLLVTQLHTVLFFPVDGQKLHCKKPSLNSKPRTCIDQRIGHVMRGSWGSIQI